MKTDDFSELYDKTDESFFTERLLPNETIMWTGTGKKPFPWPARIISLILLTFFAGFTVLSFMTGVPTAYLLAIFILLLCIRSVIMAFNIKYPDQYAVTNMRVIIVNGQKARGIYLERIAEATSSFYKPGDGTVNLKIKVSPDPYYSQHFIYQYMDGLAEPEYVCGLILSNRDKLLENS